MSQRDEYYEEEFQTEMHTMRRHIQELFTHMLPEPRIIEDFTGKGAKALLSTPLWPDGPAWQALPGIAKADLPTSEKEARNKAKVWDVWLTDYSPAFWPRYFGDCPFTVRGATVLCPSSIGAQTAEDL
jgi:hypothetical protein